MTSKLPPYLLEHLPWEQEADPIWPATTLVLRRNLSRRLFPPKLKEREALSVEEDLKNALLAQADFTEPQFFSAEMLSATDKEYLFEHFLCREGFQNTLRGQGFLIEKSASILALFNIEDHLQLHLSACKAGLEKAWTSLSQISSSIAKILDFAYAPKWGFLTSHPSQCGTALQATAFLHLPALIRMERIQDALAKQKEEEIEVSGMQGTPDVFLGDLLILANRFSLGVSEDTIFYALHSAATELTLLEKKLREELRHDSKAELKDLVFRAFGLLMHSYQLQTPETLDALSLMKLGLDLGWLTGVSDRTLNEIFFQCRKAHLTYLAEEKDPKNLPHARAAFIHKKLAPMQLVADPNLR